MLQAALKPCAAFAEELFTCFCFQVSPPSVETATTCGIGSACPFELLRNSSTHMYTFPKNGLDAALSAQICSLSSNVVELVRGVARTGGIQLFLSSTLVAVGLSSRETPTARNPLNGSFCGKPPLSEAVRLA